MQRQKLESLLGQAEDRFTGFMLPKDGSRVPRALVADLSSREFSDFGIPRSWCEKYISGPALAARIWARFNEDGMRDDDRPVVIATGACASSLMPFSGLTSIAFRSPQSGRMAVNTMSCTFGNKLDSLGYSALVLIGRNPRIGVLELSDRWQRVEVSESFLNASPAQVGEFYPSAESSILCTGRAADNGVRFASAVCDGLLSGRGGLGCAMGRKNLKAIVLTTHDRGQRKNLTKERKAAYNAIEKACEASPLCRDIRKTGTYRTVDGAIAANAVPVDGFSGARDARLVHLTSSETVGHIPSASIDCEGCRIGCRLCGAGGAELPSADAVMMLGPNLGCCDMARICERFSLCLETGMDFVSAGCVLGHMRVAPDDVMKSLSLMADGKLAIPDDVPCTGGLECGPLDYRGSWTDAVNACSGRWFSQYFGRFCKNSPSTVAKLVSFNEILVMGLQSFGLSEGCLNLMLGNRSGLHSLLIGFFPVLSVYRLRADEILNALSQVVGRTVTLNDILMVGRRARMAIDTINGCSDGLTVRIPDFFCTDAGTEGVVPFVALAEEYRRQRAADMAKAEPEAN